MPYGENHHSAKLTEQNVRDIRRQFEADGVTSILRKYEMIAERFGVCAGSIEKIIKRRIWRRVK